MGESLTAVEKQMGTLRFGESLQRPEYRVVPLRDAPYTRLVHSVLRARSSSTDPTSTPLLNNGDVAIILDAGCKGNKSRLLQPWRQGVQDAKKREAELDSTDGTQVEDDVTHVSDDESVQVPLGPGFVPTLLCLAYTEESVTQNRRRNSFQTGLAMGFTNRVGAHCISFSDLPS